MGAEVRFIEYMDVGGATQLVARLASSRGRRCSRRLAAHYGRVAPIVEDESSAPADRFELPDGTTVRHHLVDDRAVLQQLRSQPADGRRHVVLCLYAARGIDLRAPLRRGASGADIAAIIRAGWRQRERPRRRRAAGAGRPPRVRADHIAEKRPAPGDAHSGGLALRAAGWGLGLGDLRDRGRL